MDFRSATDRIAAAGVTLAAIAAWMDSTPQNLSRMRRMPSDAAARHRNTYNPPPDWREELIQFCSDQALFKRIEADRLEELVAELRRDVEAINSNAL